MTGGYFCRECGTVYPTLPIGMDGRCPKCLRILRVNPYAGLAGMAIEYLRGPRDRFWSDGEMLAVARTMVSILERRVAAEAASASCLDGLVERALEQEAVAEK